MEVKKERLSNLYIQLLLQYILIVGVACFMLDRGHEGSVLIVSAVLLVYAVFAKLIRVKVESFFSNVMAHFLVALVYGMMVCLWINSDMLPYKNVMSGGTLTGLVSISVTGMLIFSLQMVYRRTELDSSETVPVMVVFVPAVGALIAELGGMLLWQHTCVIAFVILVTLLIVRNYAKGARELRAQYGYDTDYPGMQINKVFNALTLMLGAGVAVVMSVMYVGSYGNYVFVALKGVIYNLFGLLKLIPRREWGNETEYTTGETTTAAIKEVESTTLDLGNSETATPEHASIQYVTRPESVAEQVLVNGDDEWKIWLMIIAFFLVLLVIVVVIVEMLSQYIRSVRKNYKIGNDEFSVWSPDDEEEEEEEVPEAEPETKGGVWKRIKYKLEEIQEGDRKSRAVRRIYKDRVMGDSVIKKVKGFPDNITRKYIADDEEKAKIITDIYEKARYSDLKISKEEAAQFMEALKENEAKQ